MLTRCPDAFSTSGMGGERERERERAQAEYRRFSDAGNELRRMAELLGKEGK